MASKKKLPAKPTMKEAFNAAQGPAVGRPYGKKTSSGQGPAVARPYGKSVKKKMGK
jgi:hypothetical protein